MKANKGLVASSLKVTRDINDFCKILEEDPDMPPKTRVYIVLLKGYLKTWKEPRGKS